LSAGRDIAKYSKYDNDGRNFRMTLFPMTSLGLRGRQRVLWILRLLAAVAIPFALAVAHDAGAQSLPPRELPARAIPAPETVSPQLQRIIGAPISPTWNVFPKTAAEWKVLADAAAAEAAKRLPALREQLRVSIEPQTINGARAYVLTPQDLPAQNRNRLLIHVHGGCYVSNPGESGTSEATMMAGFGRFKVIAVDYRMPPEAYFPAAIEDTIAVIKLIAVRQQIVVVFLISARVRRAKQRSPMPKRLCSDAIATQQTPEPEFLNRNEDHYLAFETRGT
jgi:alpha/beta hydrolase fold